MEYNNCISAIKGFEQSKETANVSQDRNNCKCPRTPSACDWVGNSMHYACLTEEFNHPQKVYTIMNRGGFGQIIADTEKTQK